MLLCGPRCVAMLHAFCAVITDYTTPEGKSLSRDLTQACLGGWEEEGGEGEEGKKWERGGEGEEGKK